MGRRGGDGGGGVGDAAGGARETMGRGLEGAVRSWRCTWDAQVKLSL